MLLKRQILAGIVDGRITLAFRRWKRPTVRAGGRLRTAIGVLAIESVEIISERDITASDAEQAGYASRADLVSELETRGDGELYRIALRYDGTDPRLALSQQDQLSEAEIGDLRRRLSRMDRAGSHGSWTSTALELIAASPGKRAAELAESAGMTTHRFKTNVRKLKELGLTESLKVGYRLSPRGSVVLENLRSQ